MSNHRTHYLEPTQASGRHRRAGFTLVEIVVAFIIIGILTAIMVPVMTQRSSEAKVTAAREDLKRLADAENRVAIDTGYLVRLDALDDVHGGDGIYNSDILNRIDGLLDNNEPMQGTKLYDFPYNIFISISNQNYIGISGNQAGGGNQTIQESLIFRLNSQYETSYNAQTYWGGPYVNWQRDVNHNDWPDDPWGNDYILFSRVGMIRPPNPAGLNADEQQDYSDVFHETAPAPFTNLDTNDLFDRFTLLSLGPNGLPGDGSGVSPGTGDYGQGDDIVVQFGGS